MNLETTAAIIVSILIVGGILYKWTRKSTDSLPTHALVKRPRNDDENLGND